MAITLELEQLVLRYADLRVLEPGRRARLAASLAAEGQREPVLVVQEDDTYLLIDGYLRVDALGKLALDTVEAVVIDVEELDALVLTWRLQRSRRRSAIEDGWLVQSLVECHALSQTEVARRLQRSKGWVSERLALVQVLPREVQEAVRTGQIAARGAMRFLVPMARREEAHCVRLIAGLKGEKLSVSELERLYRAWLEADDELRGRIVDQPLLYLKVEAVAEKRIEPTPLQDLATMLESISGSCRRVRKRLREGVFAGANTADRNGGRPSETTWWASASGHASVSHPLPGLSHGGVGGCRRDRTGVRSSRPEAAREHRLVADSRRLLPPPHPRGGPSWTTTWSNC